MLIRVVFVMSAHGTLTSGFAKSSNKYVMMLQYFIPEFHFIVCLVGRYFL